MGPTTPPQKPGTVWAGPRSLAATSGVSIDFLSYGYLDVSVPRVGFSFEMTRHDSRRVSPFGHPRINRVLARSPRLFAGSYVLHRLLLPRHPPCALCSLNTVARTYLGRQDELGIQWHVAVDALGRRVH